MSIDLNFLLHKNKSSIKEFIAKNKIKSYNDLISYCKERNIIPISIETYQLNLEAVAEKKVANVKRKTEKPKEPRKKTAKRSTRATRKTSKS